MNEDNNTNLSHNLLRIEEELDLLTTHGLRIVPLISDLAKQLIISDIDAGMSYQKARKMMYQILNISYKMQEEINVIRNQTHGSI